MNIGGFYKRNISEGDMIEEKIPMKKSFMNKAQKCLDEAKSEKDLLTIVIKLDNISFCFSRDNMNNIVQEVWTRQGDFNNVYFYLESLNLFLTGDFKNKLEHGNVFVLSFEGNGNFVKIGKEFEQDVVVDTAFYTAISKQSNMDVLTSLFSDMKVEEKKTVDDLSDIFLGMKIEEKKDIHEIADPRNPKYQCGNVDKTQDVFIFKIADNYFCMNIEEVIVMLEDYLQSETSKERFYKLPFNNICIDNSLLLLFEKKISAISLSFDRFETLKRKNGEKGDFRVFTASELDVPLDFPKKFKGDVLFDIEIYRSKYTYDITYRRKGKKYRYRNNAPDSFVYDASDGEVRSVEWHQQNKHSHRNGLKGPGKVSFKNGRKEAEEYYNDNDKLHSYNGKPSVIKYNPTNDNGIIIKKEYHDNGNLVRTEIFDFDTGALIESRIHN